VLKTDDLSRELKIDILRRWEYDARQLEFQMTIAVPVQDVHVVLYDDNGKRADLAAVTLGANRQLRRPHPQHHRHPGAQRLGLHNVSGLKNGTSGWVLAGYDLETGADRLDLPEPSPEGLAAAEAYADRLAAEDGVRDIDRWETALGDKFATS
jgi:hypothetical protein